MSETQVLPVMFDTVLSIAVVFLTCALSLMLALVIVLAIDRVRNKRDRERIAEECERHCERLRTPQFDAVASMFDCRLPDDVFNLYRTPEEAGREDFEILRPDGKHPIYVAHYCPCDPESVVNAYPACRQLFTFASDGGDLAYAIDPRLENPPVVEYDAETGCFTQVADSLAQFLRWDRRPAY